VCARGVRYKASVGRQQYIHSYNGVFRSQWKVYRDWRWEAYLFSDIFDTESKGPLSRRIWEAEGGMDGSLRRADGNAICKRDSVSDRRR
jgi:hypothetical protein